MFPNTSCFRDVPVGHGSRMKSVLSGCVTGSAVDTLDTARQGSATSLWITMYPFYFRFWHSGEQDMGVSV